MGRSLIEDILYTSFMEHGELSDFLEFLHSEFMCVCGEWVGLCARVGEAM